MLKTILSIVFLIIAGILGWLLWETIQEPIRFQETLEKREKDVRSKLKRIAGLQSTYKDLTGSYAPSFDTLEQVLMNDTFLVLRIEGDPDDSTTVVRRDTLLIPARDSMKRLGVDFATLPIVPHSKDNAERFTVVTDSIAQPGLEGVMVSVFEVKTQIKVYMHDFLDEEGEEAKYRRFDATFKPSTVRKVGDLNNPTTAGNW